MSEEIIKVGERLLRLRDVKAKTSLGHASIYRYMEDGKFPRPLSLGPNAVRWKESEIDAWIQELPRTEPRS